MTPRRLRAPAPATLVAFLALFLALSGTVYAGVKIARNSVGSGEIKNRSVKGGDLADNTLTGEQIDEGSLGVVPRAASAGTAAAASSAASAGTAKTADRANSAALADKATTADRATYADRAGVATTASTAGAAATASTADRATEADHAANADEVGGHVASDFASSSSTFGVAVKLAGGETRVLAARDGVRLEARCSANETTIGSTTPASSILRIYAYASAPGATLESPYGTFDGSSDQKTLGPNSGVNGLALKVLLPNGKTGESVPDSGIILTSVGGTSIFFGTTGGIRVAFGLNGAVCSVSAPVVIATP